MGPRTFLRGFRLVGALWVGLMMGNCASVHGGEAFPASTQVSSGSSGQPMRPMHFSSERTVWDRKNDRVKLLGKARVSEPSGTITADEITIDQKSQQMNAKGNCVYITGDAIVYGDALSVDLATGVGTIEGGRITNDRFALTGQKIERLSESRYRTQDGTYTTCLDCPQSWTLAADSIDMEIEGYAQMKGVTWRVKDSPLLWLPYLVVPLKKTRQSGFLFPRFGFFNGSFTYSVPFFWAINRSTDATITLGEFAGRGARAELEARYSLSPISGGTLKLFFLRDKTFLNELKLPSNSEFLRARNRVALDVEQTQELPWGVTQKLRILESSDNRYPIFIGDIPGRGEAVLASDLIFSRHTDEFSAYVAGRRFRNLLSFSPLDDSEAKAKAAVNFDPDTVQQFPTAVLTTRDRFLFGSRVAGGLTLGLSNFSRASGPFDRLPSLSNPDQMPDPARLIVLGQDPLRRATRFSLTPTLYTTLRPMDVVSLVPSLEYRGFYYSFGSAAPSLTRGYLLMRADLSTQLERIFETANPSSPKVKHVIRPVLSYSLIPLVNENASHPFLKQIQFARDRSITGLNFDNSDIVPLESTLSSSNYFVPLGNALTFGLTTQLIRRQGEINRTDATYRRDLEFRLGETYNFRENSPSGSGRPFSRLFASLYSQGDQITTSTDYFYYPYLTMGRPRSTVSTSATYVLRRGVNRRIYEFDRSISLGYVYNFTNQSATSNLRASLAYSLSDYVLPSGYVSYDFVTRQIIDTGVALRFQSPAQCFRVDVGVRQFKCAGVGGNGICTNPTIDFMLNLAGSGFSGVSPVQPN